MSVWGKKLQGFNTALQKTCRKGEGRTLQAAELLPDASLLVTPPWTLINSKQLLGLIPCWYITVRSVQMELKKKKKNNLLITAYLP